MCLPWNHKEPQSNIKVLGMRSQVYIHINMEAAKKDPKGILAC